MRIIADSFVAPPGIWLPYMAATPIGNAYDPFMVTSFPPPSWAKATLGRSYQQYNTSAYQNGMPPVKGS